MIPRRMRLKRVNGNAYVVRLAQLRHDTAAMKHSTGTIFANAAISFAAMQKSLRTFDEMFGPKR